MVRARGMVVKAGRTHDREGGRDEGNEEGGCQKLHGVVVVVGISFGACGLEMWSVRME